MRQLLALVILSAVLLPAATLRAGEAAPPAPAETAKPAPAEPKHEFAWQTGKVELAGRIATIDLPSGFRFIGNQDARFVLEKMWGNPPSPEVLGMVFPVATEPTADDAWAIVVTFEESGYVKDDDAKTINYDDLLKQLQESSRAGNKERVKAGYPAVELLPWGEPPHYDPVTHKMYWAKRLRFGDSPEATLNYNVRVLGRRGVLVLNAVASDPQLALVAEGSKQVLATTEFTEGNRYQDFSESSGDKIAAYGIAGLVAGGLLLKGGFLKVLLALIKPILVGCAVVGGVVYKLFTGKRRNDQA